MCIALWSVARYDEGSEMDEQKRTDPQEQEQEQKIDDLEVPDEQGDAVKGGLANVDLQNIQST